MALNVIMCQCFKLSVIITLFIACCTTIEGEKVVQQRAGECVTCDENAVWTEKVKSMERRANFLERRHTRMDDSLTDLEECDCER